MCLYPKLILNPKYTSNQKNKGNPPELKNDKIKFVPVGCGNCIECSKQRARNWQIRLQEEIKNTKEKPYFMAFTFSPEGYSKCYNAVKHNKLNAYETDNNICKYAVRHFLEIWRKHTGKSVKHWLVTELGHGETEHVHIHGIIWGNPDLIRKHWKYGIVWVGDKPNNWVNNQTINYIIKYVTKIDKQHSEYKPLVLCSPGIGKNYIGSVNSNLNKFKGSNTDETYKTKSGHKISLPVYYRNKLYTDAQKETLWINKINKQERYILGQKVKIKTSEEQDNYFKTLEEAQSKNKRLGYGDDTINWDIREYQNEKRLQKQYQRGVITKEEMLTAINKFKQYANKRRSL
nr:MAG: replication initiator protein [Microvirus sp.]